MTTRKRIMISRFAKFSMFCCIIVIFGAGCKERMPVADESNLIPSINPDYTSVTIPPNIAPLNFRINETADKYVVRFYNSNGIDFMVSSGDGMIRIPEMKWRRLLSASVSKEFYEEIAVKKSGKWVKFKTITNYVARDSIDKYLVYRLIDPEFETWNTMGIYQRNLENFKVTPVMLNRVSDGNCVNCHTFCQNSSKTLMFHMRSEHAGTVIYRDGKLSKINTKTDKTIANGMYPAWHPSGNYIAFSVNNIVQSYHAIPGRTVEVYDTLSNIVLYDVNKNVITSCSAIIGP